jgi:hypothetical protein
MKNDEQRRSILLSVKGSVVQEAGEVARKTGLKLKQVLAIATETGWPIVLKRCQDAFAGK